jgi:hypothetical protein
MGLADELTKLDALRKSGALSEAEFQEAKTKLLHESAAETPLHEVRDEMPFEEESVSERILHSKICRDLCDDDGDQSLGRAANRYVSYQIVMGVIGAIVFLIFLFGVILPSVNRFPGSGSMIVTPSHSDVPLPPNWKR